MIVAKYIAWHSPDEKPPVDENGISEALIVGYKLSLKKWIHCSDKTRYLEASGFIYDWDTLQTFEGRGYEVVGWAYLPNPPSPEEWEKQNGTD
jgi:hypothetical protein